MVRKQAFQAESQSQRKVKSSPDWVGVAWLAMIRGFEAYGSAVIGTGVPLASQETDGTHCNHHSRHRAAGNPQIAQVESQTIKIRPRAEQTIPIVVWRHV